MIPKNRVILAKRVAQAAEAALAAQKYVSAIDVLIGMGWLDARLAEDWRRGRVDCLERVVHANLSRISEAMKLFRSWAAAKGLVPSETVYKAWRPGRGTLRFSRSGNHGIERSYRTHWVSRELSAKKPERLSRQRGPSPEPARVRLPDEADGVPLRGYAAVGESLVSEPMDSSIDYDGVDYWTTEETRSAPDH